MLSSKRLIARLVRSPPESTKLVNSSNTKTIGNADSCLRKRCNPSNHQKSIYSSASSTVSAVGNICNGARNCVVCVCKLSFCDLCGSYKRNRTPCAAHCASQNAAPVVLPLPPFPATANALCSLQRHTTGTRRCSSFRYAPRMRLFVNGGNCIYVTQIVARRHAETQANDLSGSSRAYWRCFRSRTATLCAHWVSCTMRTCDSNTRRSRCQRDRINQPTRHLLIIILIHTPLRFTQYLFDTGAIRNSHFSKIASNVRF